MCLLCLNLCRMGRYVSFWDFYQVRCLPYTQVLHAYIRVSLTSLLSFVLAVLFSLAHVVCCTSHKEVIMTVSHHPPFLLMHVFSFDSTVFFLFWVLIGRLSDIDRGCGRYHAHAHHISYDTLRQPSSSPFCPFLQSLT